MQIKKSKQSAGLTWIELMVSLAIIAILVALALPAICGGFACPAPGAQALSNMKQLHLATQQMELDGTTTGETNLRWPGDSGGTFTNWIHQLVPDYLTTNDLGHLLSVAGRRLPQGIIPTANTNGIVVYAVGTNSPTNAIFLSTANISQSPSGPRFDSSSDLFQGKLFVVFHKGGDGAILRPKQITNPEAIGTFVPLCK